MDVGHVTRGGGQTGGPTPRAKVVAVAARKREDAARFASKYCKSARVHASYDELLANPKVDAVYIPLPTGLHFEWVRRSLVAGKHVLCEKPCAANAEEARRMTDLAAEKRLVLMEGLHATLHPFLGKIRGIVSSGALGELRSINASFDVPRGTYGPTNNRYAFSMAGGAVMDLGGYVLGCMAAIMGEQPQVTSARVAAWDGDRQIDEITAGTLSFPGSGRAEGSFNVSFVGSAFRTRMTIHGSRGGLRAADFVLSPTVTLSFLDAAGRPSSRPDEKDGLAKNKKSASTYTLQLDAFIDAVAAARGPREGAAGLDAPNTGAHIVRLARTLDSVYVVAGLKPRVGKSGIVSEISSSAVSGAVQTDGRGHGGGGGAGGGRGAGAAGRGFLSWLQQQRQGFRQQQQNRRRALESAAEPRRGPVRPASAGLSTSVREGGGRKSHRPHGGAKGVGFKGGSFPRAGVRVPAHVSSPCQAHRPSSDPLRKGLSGRQPGLNFPFGHVVDQPLHATLAAQGAFTLRRVIDPESCRRVQAHLEFGGRAGLPMADRTASNRGQPGRLKNLIYSEELHRSGMLPLLPVLDELWNMTSLWFVAHEILTGSSDRPADPSLDYRNLVSELVTITIHNNAAMPQRSTFQNPHWDVRNDFEAKFVFVDIPLVSVLDPAAGPLEVWPATHSARYSKVFRDAAPILRQGPAERQYWHCFGEMMNLTRAWPSSLHFTEVGDIIVRNPATWHRGTPNRKAHVRDMITILLARRHK